MAHPTGDELALLKAVASAPDDDLPRLVYADWLEERGRGGRAEFIRLQIAGEHPMAGTQRASIRGRMEELLNAHRSEWFRELPRWARRWYADRPSERVQYRRGFVEEVSVYASHFLRFGPQLLDRTPVVRLNVYELGGAWKALAGCSWLGRVPQLNLSHERLEVNGAAAVARNRHMGGVRDLDLRACWLTDSAVRALADAESLTGLTRLDLSLNHLTVSAVKALRGANFLRSLEVVNLRYNPQLRGHEDRIRNWLGERVVL